jgi:hypothetical protein
LYYRTPKLAGWRAAGGNSGAANIVLASQIVSHTINSTDQAAVQFSVAITWATPITGTYYVQTAIQFVSGTAGGQWTVSPGAAINLTANGCTVTGVLSGWADNNGVTFNIGDVFLMIVTAISAPLG